MPRELTVEEGVQEQSSAEQIAYTLDVTKYPGSGDPSAVAVTATQIDTDGDVTGAVFPANAPTVLGNVITLDLLRNLVVNKSYRIEIQFTRTGNTFQPHFIVRCIY